MADLASGFDSLPEAQTQAQAQAEHAAKAGPEVGPEPGSEAGPGPGPEAGPEAEPAVEAPAVDEEIRAAMGLLYRVIQPEPRLRIGEVEALALAPLVAEWQRRGGTPEDLARALLPGLPSLVHSAPGMLRSRLERKMPPAPDVPPEPARVASSGSGRSPGLSGPFARSGLSARSGSPGSSGMPVVPRPRASYAECAKCHDPVPSPGICGPCAGLAPRPVAVGGGAGVVRVGAQRARAALRAARDVLPISHCLPAVTG
ncbi:hypothetical protein HUT16_21020 [Kitasatospora sp. NA04385]|uniref:hypothetical protein n=1 Tax=Kitasatospora sp. NA04385 TaxID=2742135 RepID=UPI0015922439|nr:hypothetical protein [Kitasatospora sp. NA04385]QKW21210.1 hypothetical protein HUT16_21020 [Kitasatospora sp. NA04385]